jgi:hypothetical protein
MKPIRTKPTLPVPLLALAFVLAASAVQAASFVVYPGQSLQAAIDAAAAGDNITVQTGTYNENLTITRGIDIRGTGGAVLVTGTLTITNPVLPVYLADITWGKAGATGMTFTGTASQNVRLDRCKLVNGGNLSSTGLNSYFYKIEFSGSVTFTSAVWTMQRCTVAGNLQSTNSTAKCVASTVTGGLIHNGSTAGEATIFQSNLRENTEITLPSGSKKAWVAYSTLRYLVLSGGAVEIVGNHFDGRDRGDYFISTGSNCVATIRNNHLFNDDRNYSSQVGWRHGASGIRVRGDAGLTRIFNNSIREIFQGIEVQGLPTGVEIRGNIHRESVNASYSVNTGYAGTVIANNNFEYAVTGGVQSDNINVDPQFITGPNGEISWLNTTSPSRNVGPADTLFNDLDGSRNDQGAYGGHSYDPTGRTTLKPVVLSGEVSPLYVKRGGAVTITARAAVAAAP